MADQGEAVVVACGPWPPREVVGELVSQGKLLVACDGALALCEQHGFHVDVLVGDMDSIEQQRLEAYAESGGTVIRRPQQDTNDLSKALVYLEERGVEACTIFGATGGDLQHEWANLLSCAASSLEITCLGTDYRYRLLNPGVGYSIDFFPGAEFSLFALPTASDVRLSGAAYPLHDATLEMGSQGLHNVAVHDTVEISFNEGRLMMMEVLPTEPLEGRNEA